jgi:FlaA1/EpsC-like NDP-sugar epimerase
MVVIRTSSRLLRDRLYRKEHGEKKRVLIYGAGSRGNLAANWLRDRVEIIGFLDDDRAKRHRRVQQFRVLGGRYDIEPLSKIYPIEEVVIAISDLDDRTLDKIISLCCEASVKYTLFTTVFGSYTDRLHEEYALSRRVLEWIGGEELRVDLKHLNTAFSDKGLLLIGPSNSLGHELLQNLSSLNTGEIILLDKYESYLNDTLQRALEFIPEQRVRSIVYSEPLPTSVGSVLSRARPPSIIIHLGTRKYPYSMKEDLLHVTRDNILNTWDLLQLARKAGCDHFIMTSSISAANPTNYIQATLRLAENYILSAGGNSTIRNSIVRLYDSLENRGSLLRMIQNQLRDGRKILLNHPEEERYFFTNSSAANLILLSPSLTLDGGVSGKQGVYIPVLNGKVNVLELTNLIIRDYGLDPDRDVEIAFSRSTNSAEWKDELAFDVRAVEDTAHEKVKRLVSTRIFPANQAEEDIGEFREMVENEDREGLVRKVDQVMRKIRRAESK